MVIIQTLLQLAGVALIILYFTVEPMSSWLVLTAGIILAILGHFGRSMTKGRLHMAARRGDVMEMQHWLAKGFKINSKRENGLTPLHWVAFKGYLAAAQFLVENGANINSRDTVGKTPLKHARDQGNADVASFLEKSGATE